MILKYYIYNFNNNMAQNLNSTIILEEEIDENYEPTYQGTIMFLV